MAVVCQSHHTHLMDWTPQKGLTMEWFIGIVFIAILLLMASTDLLMSWFS
jgi:hypothetical protein